MSLIVRIRGALQRGCCANYLIVKHHCAIASKKIAVQPVWPFEAFIGADLHHNSDQSSALTLTSPAPDALLAVRSSDPVASLFDERPLDQPELDAFLLESFLGHDTPLSNSRTCSTEVISLLADWLVDSIDTGGTRGIPEISPHLEAVTIERNDGELVRNVEKLCGLSGYERLLQLLRFSVYLSSNNLLSKDATDNLLRWIIQSGQSWALNHLLDLKGPTTAIFASNILVSAIRLESFDTVHLLISKGADVNATAEYGWYRATPLIHAISKRSVKLVKMLLDAGADPNICCGNKSFTTTAVLRAVETRCSVEIVQLLLDFGTDLNAPPDSNLEPVLQCAVKRKNIEIVRLLLDAGADVDNIRGPDGTVLQIAAQSKGNTKIVQLLLDAGADVNAPAGNKYGPMLEEALDEECDDEKRLECFPTPLQWAAEYENIEVVKLLLEGGADLDLCPTNGEEVELRRLEIEISFNDTTAIRTALQAAVANGNIILVQLLLDAGASANAPGCGETALQLAARMNDINLVRTLLLHGADINAPANQYHGRTALQAAAETGGDELVQLLIDEGADIHAPAAFTGGKTALQAAAKSGNPILVQKLIGFGARVNASASFAGSFTAFQAAAGEGDVKIMTILLEAGADINAKAAHTAGRTALQAAVEWDDISAVEFLIGAGAAVNGAPSTSQGMSALQASLQNQNTEITKLLLRNNANPNLYSTGGESPLQLATQYGSLSLIQSLIDAGAAVNAPPDVKYCRPDGEPNRTVLQYAAIINKYDAVKILLSAGADVNAPSVGVGGMSALQAAVLTRNIDLVRMLLQKGADPSFPDESFDWPGIGSEIVKMLIEAGADVNAQPSPLVNATIDGSSELVQILLNAGANVNSPGSDGITRITALQAAVSHKRVDLVRTIMNAGADVNAPAAYNGGATALQYAASTGSIQLVEILLASGADVNAPAAGNRGYTALQGAAMHGHLRIALMLLKAGADVNGAPAEEEGRTALEAAAENGRLDVLHLLLHNDDDTEALEMRCEQAAKLAQREGHLLIARILREYQRA